MAFVRIIAGMAALIALSPTATAAAAETPASPESPPAAAVAGPRAGEAVWLKTPSERQMSSAYPMDAARNEKTGVAVVSCQARADGSLRGCKLVCEAPDGWGFGKAALEMARLYRIQPTLTDGSPALGFTVTKPFYFYPAFLPQPKRCDAPGR